MGGVVQSLFGGGSYQTPDAIQYDPVPTRTEAQEPESQAVRDEERRKLKARRSMSGTLLTSPLGASGNTNTGTSSGLLGRI